MGEGAYSFVGRRTHSLLALLIRPLITHPFRDGAPFLLLIETPPTFGSSFRFFLHITHTNCLLILGIGGEGSPRSCHNQDM